MTVLVVAALAITACNVAPREVETVITLGAERVDIDVQLRDIRTGERDDLYQLQVFESLSAWESRWTEDLGWAPTPDAYRYSADAGRLSLSMHATMKRADFDRCARGFSSDGGEEVCSRFPLRLTSKGYAVPDGFVEKQQLVLARGSKTSWPADAKVLAVTLGLTEQTEKVTTGPSLLRGYEVFTASPEGARATVKLINETEKRLFAGPPEEFKKAIAELKTCTEAPWCALRSEAIRRLQARVLNRFLAELPEANVSLPEAPEDPRMMMPESLRTMVPTDKLAPIDALRLRVRYDIGLEAYRTTGSLEWGGATFVGICRPEVVKKRSLKDLCIRLGAL